MKAILRLVSILALVAGTSVVRADDETKTPDTATTCPSGVAGATNDGRRFGGDTIDRGSGSSGNNRTGSDIDRGPSSSGGGRGDSAP